MSKYNMLWEYIRNKQKGDLYLTFDEIQEVLGFPIDHSILNCKKELLEFGFIVDKISLKSKIIHFIKIAKQ